MREIKQLRLPFETRSVGDQVPTTVPNTMPLTDAATSFSRSAQVEWQNASVVAPANADFKFVKADHYCLDQVNLSVSLTVDPNINSHGDGIADLTEWVNVTAFCNREPVSTIKIILARCQDRIGHAYSSTISSEARERV